MFINFEVANARTLYLFLHILLPILGQDRGLLQMHQMDQSYDGWTSSLSKGSRFSSAEKQWDLSTLQT